MRKQIKFNKYEIKKMRTDNNNVEYEACPINEFFDEVNRDFEIEIDKRMYKVSSHIIMRHQNNIIGYILRFKGGVDNEKSNYYNKRTGEERRNQRGDFEVEKKEYSIIMIQDLNVTNTIDIYAEERRGLITFSGIYNMWVRNQVINLNYELNRVMRENFLQEIENAKRVLEYTEVYKSYDESGLLVNPEESTVDCKATLSLTPQRRGGTVSIERIRQFFTREDENRTKIKAVIKDQNDTQLSIVQDRFQDKIVEEMIFDEQDGAVKDNEIKELIRSKILREDIEFEE